MSRTLSLISPAGQYASPNQLVTAQIATNVGFNANDYVYAYGNNQVGSLGATIGLGTVSTFIAGKKVSGAIQNGFAPTSVMVGPYSASATYTGVTRSQSSVFQGPTQVSANNASFSRMCVLNNGNIAMIYRESGDTYTRWTVFTSAGATIKAPEILSFQGSVGTNETSISISGMADGGFVIAFTTDNSSCRFSRFSSNGTRLVDQTVLSGNLASYKANLNIAGVSTGGFMVTGNASGSQTYIQSYGSDNVYLGEVTLSGATNTYENAIIGLSNGNCAVGMLQGSNTFYYAILTPSLNVVFPWTSINNQGGGGFNMAAYDGGFVVAGRNPNNGYHRIMSVANNGTVISSGVEGYQTNASQWSVAVGENNTAYFLFLASSTWFITKYVQINSSSIKAETTFSISTYAPNGYTSNNFYSALNGAFYHAAQFSTKPSFSTINVETYTQNTTVLTNQGLYTPPNGYYFLGVAATTAAANSSGLVYTNGGIALPSTYPSVTTGYAFDYQSNGYWAQRGTINGRAINLQGAQ